MTSINRVLNDFPTTVVPNEIYLVKKGTGIELGISTQNPVTPEVVQLKKPMTIQGPTSLFHGEVGTFKITNYGTDTDYTVSSLDGTISRVNDTVTFTCSDTSKTSASFKIGYRTITIPMKAIKPKEAVIQSPVSGSSVNASGLQLTTGAFQMNYSLAGDTHLSTDWEIATDPGFTNIVKSSYNDTVNKTTFTP